MPDHIIDFGNFTPNENDSRVYLPAVQEVDPPEITVINWTFQPCSDRNLGDCANITLSLRDSGSGLLAVSAQHLRPV